jgi:hypothetical protein
MSGHDMFASEICTSHRYCDTCRARHAGRTWRKTQRRAFRLPEDDFDCPEGKPWIDDRATTDRPDAPRPTPCGGCGKAGAAPLSGETRPSCRECVEKHLGAAWILLTECRDGYPHRLRAIGHLHEAEDESQTWPRLHEAIREARKRFQREGTVPDFASLANLAGEISGTGST